MMNIMNKIIFAMLSMTVLLLSCQKEFEKTYDLKVDARSYTISAEGGDFHLYVYSSGEWTAELDSFKDWIRIQPGSENGYGIGLVRLQADYNYDTVRTVNLLLSSGPYRDTICISQNYDATIWEIK